MKFKFTSRGWREEHNQARLEDMRGGEPVWGNGCEAQGCLIGADLWIEFDGLVYELCRTHAAKAEAEKKLGA